MTKHMRALCASTFLALALAGTACAAAGQGEQTEKIEPAPISEGVDTSCEVSFARYTGSYKDLFLNQGDRIAVISPSALPTQAQVDATVAGLESWGYEPVLGKHVCEETRSLQDCVDDLAWALSDPDIKAIFCVRGGYGASEVTDALDSQLVASSGKLIIGYSDITAYHSLWSSVGQPSVHACMSATFDGLSDASVEAERRLLAGELPTYTCAANDLCKPGEAEGVLVGGNLATLTSVLGTAYDCTRMDQPFILFLEDVGETSRSTHRFLMILKHLGVLDRAAGIVFGEWTDLPEDVWSDYNGNSRGGTFDSVYDMVARQIVDDVDVPVAFGFPAGHGDTNYPLLMGATAHLSVSNDSFTLGWS